jgi:magnesium transporter
MKFKINEYLLEDFENKDHPSDFVKTKNYSILVLRLPYIKKNSISSISYSFLIKKDIVYLYDRSKEDFQKIGNFDNLYDFLDEVVDKILIKLSKIHVKITKLEEEVYDENFENMSDWLIYKKELTLIEMLTYHAYFTLERFIKSYKNEIDIIAFGDLKEHIDRALKLSKMSISKLDYLHDYYRGVMDEKTNRTMFILTIMSAIFMPLTLVTGFFGMNTGGLPFLDDPYGTMKVFIVMFLFEIPFIYAIWKLTRE